MPVRLSSTPPTGELSSPSPPLVAGDIEPDGLTRRSTLKWMTLAWIGFSAATVAGLTTVARFMFP
ncbi:MAG: hypothetical protein ACM3NW_11340, partial [Syntrophomonadaceae bacterium]